MTVAQPDTYGHVGKVYPDSHFILSVSVSIRATDDPDNDEHVGEASTDNLCYVGFSPLKNDPDVEIGTRQNDISHTEWKC